MQLWLPDLAGRSGPRYRAIAEALAEDIAAGRLAPGSELPTHRLLASLVGVTIGTVTRAYNEAKRRGLVVGEVGRGTFVSEETEINGAIDPVMAAREIIDLRTNQPAVDHGSQSLNETLRELSARRNLGALLDYQPAPGRERHRQAGAQWVARAGVEAPPSRIVICNGAQQALMAAIATLTRPGDVIATEAVNYPGIRRLTDLFHVRLHGLAMDQHGLMPRAFAEACAGERIAALICTPTIQNPTATTMPAERRREVAKLAARHGVPIIEDDMYGQLPEDRPPPISTLGIATCYYIGGTSKALAPGLRIGYLVPPDEMVRACADAVHTTTWTTSSLVAEIASLWMDNGTADRLIAWHRCETAARQAIAHRYLAGFDYLPQPASYHLWLQLGDPTVSAELGFRAEAAGVAISPGEAFVMPPGPPPGAVRISLGAPRTHKLLETGLARLAPLLRTAARPNQTVV